MTSGATLDYRSSSPTRTSPIRLSRMVCFSVLVSVTCLSLLYTLFHL
jgi:hypothetical protein